MDLRKKVGMVTNYAKSISSRGLNNKKTDKFTKQLRVLGCFGNQHEGGELPPCEHLKQSSTAGKYYCGGCGCGDRKATWLIAGGDEYSKLDYPKLNCPLNMPGFDTEKSKTIVESDPDIMTRKLYIEQMNDEDINCISVTSLEMPEHIKKAIETRENNNKSNSE